MPTTLQPGQKAPDFSLPNQDQATVSLEGLRGRPVIVYFYPKDNTPGCTTEACELRDEYGELRKQGAVILGVSPDSPESHAEFRAKYGLPFDLLSDADHQVAESYGAWGERSMQEKRSMGILRSTFVVGPDGTLTAVFPKVTPEGHADELLAALR